MPGWLLGLILVGVYYTGLICGYILRKVKEK